MYITLPWKAMIGMDGSADHNKKTTDILHIVVHVYKRR